MGICSSVVNAAKNLGSLGGKRRKILSQYEFRDCRPVFCPMRKVPNYDYVVIPLLKKDLDYKDQFDKNVFMIFDVQTMKPKHELEIKDKECFFKYHIEFPGNGQIEISYPTVGSSRGYFHTLQITNDGVKEISKRENYDTSYQSKYPPQVKALFDKVSQNENEKISHSIICHSDKYVAISQNYYTADSWGEKRAISKIIDIYSIPTSSKISSLNTGKVLDREVGISAMSGIFYDDNTLILGLASEVNIVDIKTGNTTKKVVLDKKQPIEGIEKRNNGEILAIMRNLTFHRLTLDGTIVGKSLGNGPEMCHGNYCLIDDKRFLGNYDKLLALEEFEENAQ